MRPLMHLCGKFKEQRRMLKARERLASNLAKRVRNNGSGGRGWRGGGNGGMMGCGFW
jgi:hypothetical protein